MLIFNSGSRMGAASLAVPLCIGLCLMFSGCGGGGGGGSVQPPTTIITPTFTFAAPDAATVGSNATPGPQAPIVNGTAFPLKQSAMAITATSIQPDTAAENAGATLTVNTWNPAGTSQFTLAIPGLSVNASFASDTLLLGGGTIATGNLTITTTTLNYTALGAWVLNSSTPVSTAHAAAFVTGFATPAASMPNSGTATYSGTGNVSGLVVQNTSSGPAAAALAGNGSFSANFATGTVTGSLTGITATNSSTNVTTPWNNVSITATIQSGTSAFSGSTAASSVPASGTPFAVTGAATGHVSGGFYGPNAEEAGAVWTLGDNPAGGNSTAAIGVVGGTR